MATFDCAKYDGVTDGSPLYVKFGLCYNMAYTRLEMYLERLGHEIIKK